MIPIQCSVQTYHWGKKGQNSIVGKLYFKNHNLSLQEIEANKDVTYAEFWMGDHKNGCSQVKIDKNNAKLCKIIGNQKFISENNNSYINIDKLFEIDCERFMGLKYLEVFQMKQMSFLFKFLSVNLALSISAHPNKSLAQQLHKKYPHIYKDPNHKPEIAISMSDNFLALYGFADPETIIKNFKSNPQIKNLFNYQEQTVIDSIYVRNCVNYLFSSLDYNKLLLEKIIINLVEDIKKQDQQKLDQYQTLTLKLVDQYGHQDVGILLVYFLNIINLKKGESIIIHPDELHAYIQGDIVECMVNSDNAIRCGLTPKFKDTQILFEILQFRLEKKQPLRGKIIEKSQHIEVVEYKTGYKEFEVVCVNIGKFSQNEFTTLSFNSFSIILVIRGKGNISFEDEQFESQQISELDVYYLLPQQKVKIENIQQQEELVVYIATSDI